jgi:hypothetical protein
MLRTEYGIHNTAYGVTGGDAGEGVPPCWYFLDLRWSLCAHLDARRGLDEPCRPTTHTTRQSSWLLFLPRRVAPKRAGVLIRRPTWHFGWESAWQQSGCGIGTSQGGATVDTSTNTNGQERCGWVWEEGSAIDNNLCLFPATRVLLDINDENWGDGLALGDLQHCE